MTKKQKEFIAKAVPRTHDEFTSLYIADSGKKHDSGYNCFIVIGSVDGGGLELITTWSDVVDIFEHTTLYLEIVDGFIHLWKHDKKPFVLDHGYVVSTCEFNANEHYERLYGVKI